MYRCRIVATAAFLLFAMYIAYAMPKSFEMKNMKNVIKSICYGL